MREFKFRVWHKPEKRWVNYDELSNQKIIFIHPNIDGEKFRLFKNNGDSFNHQSDDDLVIAQSTHLKDKHGEEIFEGDIIKNYWNNVDSEFIGRNWIVKFGKHDTSDDYYSSVAWGFYAEAGEEEHSLHNLPCNNDGDIEVIGNIYENPELLK